MLDLEEVMKFRRWEQGKKINFGRLLSFISEVRTFQKEIGCGKVFPAPYLGIQSRHKDRNYVLVVDMIKAQDSVYENKPIVHAQMIMGRNQVIIRIKDLNARFRNIQEITFDSDENVIKIAKGLLEIFKSAGIVPVKTADLFLGTYLDRFQTSFDDTFELLMDEELAELFEILKSFNFVLGTSGCSGCIGNFEVNIAYRNIYKDYIVSVTDTGDGSNIHWAIKKERMLEFITGLISAHDLWIADKNI